MSFAPGPSLIFAAHTRVDRRYDRANAAKIKAAAAKRREEAAARQQASRSKLQNLSRVTPELENARAHFIATGDRAKLDKYLNVMPKRSWSSRFSRRRGYGKFRRTRTGKATAFGRRKAPFRGRRRLGRFKRRFRRGRRSVKSVMPFWFKTMMKDISPTLAVGEFRNSIQGSAGQKITMTHFKALSPQDVQNAIDMMQQEWQLKVSSNTVGGAAPYTTNANPSFQFEKAYIHNLVRKHMWRNNTSHSEIEMQFYLLKPRRGPLPWYASNNSAATILSAIAPPGADETTMNNALTGGCLVRPNLWYQYFTDAPITGTPNSGSGGQISDRDPAVTPYMNPVLCQLFKIKPLRVNGPQGFKSLQRVCPGQEVSFEGKYRKPYLCNFAKFGLTGAASYDVWDTYQLLGKETPIIMVQFTGTVSHKSTDNTVVDLGLPAVDYFQAWRFEHYYRANGLRPRTFNPTQNPASGIGTSAEQVDAVTGAVAIELDS